jgi:geranylgeranyl diphosphate synthase, type II
MPTQTEIDHALAEVLSRHINADDSKSLYEAVCYTLLAPGRRICARLTLACAEMIGLDKQTAIPVAVAMEMAHCFSLISDSPSNVSRDSLLPLAMDVFCEIAGSVKEGHFARAIQKFTHSIGPQGVLGGQASKMQLNTNSSLDELRKAQAKRSGALFSASVLIPKELAGISDDSSEGIALEMFGNELGLAFEVSGDLERSTDITPQSILFYLPEQEAVNMTLQRLNNACLGLNSNWATKAQPLLVISEEIRKKLETLNHG